MSSRQDRTSGSRRGLLARGVAVVLALLPLLMVVSSGSAQQDAFSLPILVLACEEDPGALSRVGLLPPNCEPIAGAMLEAEEHDGTVIDRCTTGADGVCEISGPSYWRAIVTLDEETIPAGYRPLRNPSSRTISSGPNDLVFVTVPETALRGETATLTIHNRNCPLDYTGEDYFGDCHGVPGPSTVFFLTGPRSVDLVTGPGGNVTFTNLPPGSYEVSGGTPVDFVSYWFFCAASDQPGVAVPFARVGRGAYAGIGIDLAAGDEIICDWYNTQPDLSGPGANPLAAMHTATVTIHAWTCPRGIPAQTDLASCVDPRHTADFRFSTSDPGDTWRTVRTDHNGTATIELSYRSLPYHITPNSFSYIGWCEVSCTGTQNQEIPVTYLRVGVAIDGFSEGETVVCDWYFIPSPLRDDEPRG